MKIEISFIIPLYKGKKYIKKIMNMMDTIQKRFEKEIEIVFVNDYPDEDVSKEIDLYRSINKEIRIEVIQNSKNLGIHKSRTIGIKGCLGDYLVMLDQDDELSPNYASSQIDAIGDADAVLCNGRHFNKPLYNNIDSQTIAVKYENLINGNRIASPGQVMIKRSSVPFEWLENTLSINGADDYFLWLLITYKKYKIAINSQILYLHTISGDNASYDVETMEKSICEVCDNLYRLGIWSFDETKKRKGLTFLNKSKTAILNDTINLMIIKEWLYLKQIDRSIFPFFEDNHVRTIGVYGYGVLGRFLETELISSRVKISFFVDKIANQITNIPVVRPGDIFPDVDMLVVCVANGYGKIKDEIEAKNDYIVVSILEILGGVITDMD